MEKTMFREMQISNLRLRLVAGLVVATGISLASAGVSAQTGSSDFTTIDAPGAGTGELQGTFAAGIDTSGDVAGTYTDANSIAHGFVRTAGGTITTYTAPLAGIAGAGSTTGGKGTFFTGMDGAGDIVGYYSDANNLYHALLLPAGSTTMTYFDAPGATTFGHLGTAATGINTGGIVTGFYRDANLVYHGFVRSANGTFAQIDAPGAGTASAEGTQPLSVSSAGVIIGRYMDANFVTHGFVRSASGTITTFDPAGVATGPFTFKTENGTTPVSINTAGVIAGAYADANNVDHLFVRATDGTITEIDAPGEGGTACTANPHFLVCGTGGLSIDPAGDITGTYGDANGILHGFLRAADTGNITSFDAPGAGATSTFEGTGGFSINAGGTIAGTYVDTNLVMHGFIFTPTLTATTTTLTPVPTPNPSVYQEPVTLTASVTSSGGTPANGENVSFMSGTTSLGTAQLTGGTASLTTTNLPTGTDSVTAAYGGDASFSGSTSTAVTQTVNKASSSATLHSSLNPSTFGQSVTLTANISGQFSGVATGTVTFSSGSASLGSASVISNMATLITTALPVGTDSITAAYSGDSNFTGSTSNTLSQVVNPGSQVATPTFSPLGGTYTAAQLVTISDTTPGATIYFTTNGTTPTTNSTVYSGTIVVSSSETVEAIATLSGNSPSALASATYTINLSGSGAGEWTWIGGNSTLTCGASACGQAGVYGTPGTPASGNLPGGREGATTWTDNSGNLWLFGGAGFDAGNYGGILNDLWEFNPVTNLWTWMGGASTLPTSCAGSSTVTCGQPGVYGTLGVPASGNVPGGRSYAVGWTDLSGNLWLFGGTGFDSGEGTNDANRTVFLNDIWEYIPSKGLWTWMGGSSSMTCPSEAMYYCGQPGVYGTKGTSGAENIPGGRYSATASTDSNGKFWLFGGYGNGMYPNDLWKFDPLTDLWTWVSGGSGGQQPGVYGTEGTPAAGNVPGSRYYATSWFDGSGNFWLYGGYGFDALNNGGYLDDLWEFNPSTNYWVWLGGGNSATCWSSEACPATAIYGTLGVSAAGNTPGNRSSASGWTDKSGNFWLFGSNAWRASDSSVLNENLNDLWEFNVPSQEWAWMKGSSSANQAGVYGTLGTPAAGNTPGGRNFASSWTDNGGNLWLFGGSGLDSAGKTGNLNDLWEYKLPANASSAPTPTFSVPGGIYSSPQMVTISDTLTGSTIYYTTNGNTPTTSSSVYSGPITVSSSETIEAIAAASGYTNSAVGSAAYTINIPVAATPTFLPAAGTYTSAQSVTISDATSGATIYYTTNGTAPTTGSTVFSSSSPIAVSSSETIEAIAAATGYSNSAVTSAAYTINLPGFGAPSGSQPGSISIQPGASTGNTATISVVGTNGFSGTVNLTCSITPVAANDAPTCTLSPSSVTLSGTTAQTSTLTVTTTAATSAMIRHLWRPVGGTALAVVLMLAIPRRRRSWIAMLVLLAIAVCGTFVGCGGKSGGGGNGNSGTSAGTYTVTVTGTSGTTTATITTVSLTVQ
jgi:hypothetical protein